MRTKKTKRACDACGSEITDKNKNGQVSQSRFCLSCRSKVSDFQKEKVYKWEREFVFPQIKRDRIPYEQVQSIVNHIWASEGLANPPMVRTMDRWKHSTAEARANRLSQWYGPYTCTATILHETAHSLTGDCEEDTDHHGPTFVGTVMQLYSTYLNIPLPVLWHTAKLAGVKFDMYPKRWV